MFNKPTNEQLAVILKLYETENIPLKDKLVYLHFYIGTSDWYVMEFDGKDIFWGFAILNNDYQISEFGYFSLEEISSIRIKGFYEVECDPCWQIRTANQVEKICIAQGWALPDPSASIEIVCPNCKKTILSESDSHEIQCSECKIILQRHIDSTYQGGFSHALYPRA